MSPVIKPIPRLDSSGDHPTDDIMIEFQIWWKHSLFKEDGYINNKILHILRHLWHVQNVIMIWPIWVTIPFIESQFEIQSKFSLAGCLPTLQILWTLKALHIYFFPMYCCWTWPLTNSLKHIGFQHCLCHWLVLINSHQIRKYFYVRLTYILLLLSYNSRLVLKFEIFWIILMCLNHPHNNRFVLKFNFVVLVLYSISMYKFNVSCKVLSVFWQIYDFEMVFFIPVPMDMISVIGCLLMRLHYFNELVQEIRNSIANTLELCFSCTKPLI